MRERRLGLAVTLFATALAVFVACTTEGPTTSTTTPPTTSSGTTTTSTPSTPTTVVPTPGATSSWSGYIKPRAGWFVKNETDVPSVFYAYYTSFDNQSLALAVKTVTRQAGDTWEDTFDRTCIQVDLTYYATVVGGEGGHPFLAGFIDHNGNVVRDSQIDRSKCNPPTPPPPCRGEQCEPTTPPPPTPPPPTPPPPTPPPPPQCVGPTSGQYGPLGGPLGNPTSECSYFGSYTPTCKTEPQSVGVNINTSLPACPRTGTLFYLSKCGQSTYVVGTTYAPSCPQGQGLGWSHTTGCACLDD